MVLMMNKRTLLAVSVALVAMLGAQSAQAWDRGRHGHARIGVGFYFGVPFGGYYYPPYPYYYPPYPYHAPVVVQQPPTVYVERDPAPQAQPEQPAGYWYYCAESRAYYPYVRDCPSGWQRVAPRPG